MATGRYGRSGRLAAVDGAGKGQRVARIGHRGAFSPVAQGADVPGALVSEMEIRAHDHTLGTARVQQDPLDELVRGHFGKLAVEWQHHDVVTAGAPQNLDAAPHVGQQHRRPLWGQNCRWMGFEAHGKGLPAPGIRRPLGGVDERPVPQMNAIVVSRSDDRVGAAHQLRSPGAVNVLLLHSPTAPFETLQLECARYPR